MTNPPQSKPSTPIKPKSWSLRGKRFHNHFFFVLAALTGNHVKIYEDRPVYKGELGGGIASWSQDDELLAIQEGRRQLDAQLDEFKFVTSRASILLPVGIAASVFFLTRMEGIGDIVQPKEASIRILLLVGAAMSIWGALVMGALIGGRSEFKQIDAAQLTQESGALRSHLAQDYVESAPTGVNTNAARLTHLGTGLRWIAAGALIGIIGVAIAFW